MAIDWTELFETYKGKWVALDDDEKTVIAHGRTAKEAWAKAKRQGKKPILLEIPLEVTAYAG
jgi:hypothetical protein